MNMKKTVRKMSAILAGATMVGATVVGAMAYDLSDYPSPFIQDGFFEGKIVIGEKAMPIDIIGASDIAAAMQADSVSPVAVGGTVSVTGGTTEEVALGAALNSEWTTPLDNGDVPALKEGTVTFKVDADKESYDFHEELSFSADAVLATALSDVDEDLKDGVYMMLRQGAIRYDFVFDDLIDGDVTFNEITDEDPVTLEILGKSLEITAADPTEITVKTGETVYLNAGEKVTVGGSEVTLVKVGDSAVVVSVEGETSTIELNEDDYVGDLTVEVKSIFNDEGTADDSAELLISTDDEDVFQNGDAFIGEDEDDPNWVWVLANVNSTQPTIGVEWKPTINDLGDEPITVGESISLPNDYLKVSLVSLNQNQYQKYTVGVDDGLEIYDATGETIVYDDIAAYVFTTEGTDNDAFDVNGEETDMVVMYYNGTATIFAYEDDSNSNRLTTATGAVGFSLEYLDTSVDVAWAADRITFDLDGANDLSVYADDADDAAFLGDADGDVTAAGEVTYGATDITGWEEDVLATDGTIIYSYDASASSDELTIAIPKENTDFAVNVAVAGGKGSVTSSASGAYTVNPLPTGSTILDKDAMNLIRKTPLIVVGGPSVNTVAAELMGNPTREEINEMFTAGVGKIKLYTAENALLVAGYEGQDTLGAAYVLKDYADYDLTGTEVEVVVPSLSSISVRTPQ